MYTHEKKSCYAWFFLDEVQVQKSPPLLQREFHTVTFSFWTVPLSFQIFKWFQSIFQQCNVSSCFGCTLLSPTIPRLKVKQSYVVVVAIIPWLGLITPQHWNCRIGKIELCNAMCIVQFQCGIPKKGKVWVICAQAFLPCP